MRIAAPPASDELTLLQWFLGALVCAGVLAFIITLYPEGGRMRSVEPRRRRVSAPGWMPLAAAVFIISAIAVSPLFAHDSWINRGGFTGKGQAAGEWCCGEGDCFVLPGSAIEITAQGYRLFRAETVPFSEAQPSPDGAYWRCKRPDGSRRCFFAPPPGS